MSGWAGWLRLDSSHSPVLYARAKCRTGSLERPAVP